MNNDLILTDLNFISGGDIFAINSLFLLKNQGSNFKHREILLKHFDCISYILIHEILIELFHKISMLWLWSDISVIKT